MSVGAPFAFPPEQERQRTRARRLCWLSIALLAVAATLLFLTLGQSEAMKTAWVSDVLSMIPPAAILLAMRRELRPPTPRYPYGHFRSISVAFLVTAATLTLIGLSLLVDAGMKLLKRERPPIGTMELFGRQPWAGWVMIAALAFSMGVGMLLGRLKQPVAEALHDKVLRADSDMNRAEWMSEGAAIAGLVLVAFGRWWGDALAALLISLDILADGVQNVQQVIADLMDETPSKLGTHEPEELPGRLREAAERMEWVDRAAVRLREQGHVVTGEVFVVPRDGAAGGAADGALIERLERAGEELERADWRLHGLTVVPISALRHQSPPEA